MLILDTICERKLELDTSVNTSNPVPEVDPRSALALMHPASHEASVLDHLRELGLRRELADALDEVLVRGAVPGEDRAEEGDDGERVLVVDPIL